MNDIVTRVIENFQMSYPNLSITDLNEQYLEELFALPFNTYQVANLDGMKIYSSDTLKRKYVEAMREMDKTKPIAEAIDKLVDKSTILPAWLNKGIFRLIFFKIFAPPGSQNVLGFYTSQHDQIYLLIDNNISFGYAPNQRLMHLTIHESMHMAASHMRNSFVNLFTPEIVSFYSSMYEDLFQIPANQITKQCNTIMKYLFKEFEFNSESLTMITIKKFLKDYRELLDKSFRSLTRLPQEKFDKYLLDYIAFINLYFSDINRFINSIRSSYPHIYRAMLRGYKNGLGFENNFSLCVQELFFVSEIVCIYSEHTNNMTKVYKAFRSI